MSKKRKKRKVNKNKREKKATIQQKNSKVSLVLLVLFIFIVAGAIVWFDIPGSKPVKKVIKKETGKDLSIPLSSIETTQKSAFARPGETSYNKPVFLLAENRQNPLELAKFNLKMAQGLPHSENINVEECLNRLKEMAKKVKLETDRHLYKYKKNPKEYYNSEAYFRMLALITVLQEDFGVKYNPDLIDLNPTEDKLKQGFTTDSRDVFIHGLLTGKHQGTCASMPVLYLLVGRLLNYPLKLVPSKAHLFLRWEDDREVINLEATAQGLTIHPDEYYQTFPFKITPEENKMEYYLKSMSPEAEVATVLEVRAGILFDLGRWEEVRKIYEQILELQPNHPHARRYLSYINGMLTQKVMQRVANQKQQDNFARLKSVDRIKQEMFRMSQAHNQEYNAIIAKYMSQNNPEARRKKQQELNFLKQKYDMQIAELNRWRSQVSAGEGPPITQAHINALTGKVQQTYFQQQLQRSNEFMRKHNQRINRQNAPSGEHYKRIEANRKRIEQQRQLMNQQIKLNNQIRKARNLRFIEEENIKLRQESLKKQF